MPGPKFTEPTDAQADKIIEALEAYSFLETALAYAGASKDNARKWVMYGRRDLENSVDSPSARLIRRIDLVQAEIKVKLTKGIAKAGFEDFIRAESDKGVSYERGDFRALTWIAEHRFKEFGLKKQVEEHLEKCLDQFLDVAREVLDDVTYERLFIALEALEAARQSGEESPTEEPAEGN
jgi:hypothetical protein